MPVTDWHVRIQALCSRVELRDSPVQVRVEFTAPHGVRSRFYISLVLMELYLGQYAILIADRIVSWRLVTGVGDGNTLSRSGCVMFDLLEIRRRYAMSNRDVQL